MAKFRKKPVTVDAWPIKSFVRDGCLSFMPDPVQEQVERNHIAWDKQSKHLLIWTLEGVMEGKYEDWLIQGVNGEFYPCKPDIFEKTYEPLSKPGDDLP